MVWNNTGVAGSNFNPAQDSGWFSGWFTYGWFGGGVWGNTGTSGAAYTGQSVGAGYWSERSTSTGNWS